MSLAFARALLWGFAVYVAIGTAVAIPMAAVGIGRIDPAAKSAPWTFRALVFPGLVAFWPVFLSRYRSARAGR